MQANAGGITTPDDVLSFWFAGDWSVATMDAHERRWFGRDLLFDQVILARFRHDIRAAAAGDHDGWAGSARGRLALIIVMDQFTRNAFRASAEAYRLDSRAAELCIEGVAHGLDRSLAPIERIFFYLPLLHSERLADQDRGVEHFRQLGAEVTGVEGRYFRAWLALARRHRRIIARFGRFPHRNAVLGRTTTLPERAFLFYQRLRATGARCIRRLWRVASTAAPRA
jgi:uncharacterized protein (DUF924 family)